VIESVISQLSASDNSLVVLTIFVSVFNILRSSTSKFLVLKGEGC
jgi:hypothetical protein